jgi:hypothetical protein
VPVLQTADELEKRARVTSYGIAQEDRRGARARYNWNQIEEWRDIPSKFITITNSSAA